MKVYIYIFFSFFLYLLKKKRVSSMVWKDLLYKFSYKYSVDDFGSYRIVLTYLGSSLRKIYNKKEAFIVSSKSIILDDEIEKGFLGRKKYIKKLFNEDVDLSFCVGVDVVSLKLLQKISLSLITLFLFFIAFIASLFVKNKAQVTLIPLEILNLYFIYKCTLNAGVKDVYFFSAYEKDTVLITNFLKNEVGLNVVLFPSPNPISNFYKRVVCSTFVFTMLFQKNEYENLRHQWEVEKLLSYPPAGFDEIMKFSGRETVENTIGFMSSGNWLRKLKNRSESGNGYLDAESNLINFINNFLKKHTQIRIVVYLHPIEKANQDVLNNTITYFVKQFGKNITFADPKLPSSYQPELIDVALSPYSSAMFERLYTGYKVLFSQKGMRLNYFNDNRLFQITANNQQDFDDKLLCILKMDKKVYVNTYDLHNYIC